MSDLSQSSSQNYQQIIANFFNYKKQWSQIPEVVYLTIKAMYNQNQNIQQHIYQQKQLVAEQSVKIKQLTMQVQQLARQRIDNYPEISLIQQSGFKKSKKSGQRLTQQRPSTNRKQKYSHNNQNTYDVKQHRSISFDNGISTPIVQQIKALAQTLLKSKLSEIKLIEQQLISKISQNEAKINKNIGNLKYQVLDVIQSKIKQLELQFNRKNQVQRANVMKFIEQSAIESQKIMLQINNIHLRLSQLSKVDMFPTSRQTKFQHDKIKQNNSKQIQNISNLQFQKLNENFKNISKDFTQFKLKITKQMTFYMKSQAIQTLFDKSQKEITQKINRTNKNITQILDQFNSFKRTTITKNQSKALLSSFNMAQQQQKINGRKQKASQKSLIIIQQTLQKLQTHFKQKLKALKKQLISHVQTNLQKQKVSLKKEIKDQLEIRQKHLCQIIQINCNNLTNNQKQKSFSFNQSISLKNTVQKLSQQMILTRLLHLGQRNSKQVIQWQKNVYNSMQQNFVWKNNSHMITVMAAGLYRLEVGLYPDNQKDKIEAFVILNGVPISILKNKQVPANCIAPSRGSLFNEAILLPGRSKIWIKIQLPFFGQAYLQLLKL